MNIGCEKVEENPAIMTSKKKVLLLDSTWSPVTIISWEEAIKMVFLEKAEMIEEYSDQKIKTVSMEYPAPSVVRVNWRNSHVTNIPCSSANIFYRDKYTCGYCNKRKGKGDLTLDHIVPLSQGGGNSWKNLITACRKCNQVKGGRTPKQAKMPLAFNPIEPKWSLTFSLKLTKADPLHCWSDYLYGLDKTIIQPELEEVS